MYNKELKRVFGGAALLSALLFASSCSSSPDEAQMKQLNDLRDEVASLQKDVTAKEQDRGNIDREIAEKNARLKKCNDDQLVVKQRLAK